jgi:hypothetical protein
MIFVLKLILIFVIYLIVFMLALPSPEAAIVIVVIGAIHFAILIIGKILEIFFASGKILFSGASTVVASKAPTVVASKAPTSEEALQKQCPDCAELVSTGARICIFCSHKFAKETIFPVSIVGEQRKKLMAKHGIKYSPLTGRYKYKDREFSSFEKAAYTAFQDDNSKA